MKWWNTSFDSMTFEEQCQLGIAEDTPEGQAEYDEHREWLEMMEDLDPDEPSDW